MNKKYLSLTLAIVLFTACGGGSSSSKVAGEGSIDLKEYYPSASMTKEFIATQRDGDTVNSDTYDEVITVSGQTITTKVDAAIIEKVVFTDTNITTTTTEGTGTDISTMYRNVDLGDTLISKALSSSETNDLGQLTTNLNLVCKLNSKETKFEKNDHPYSGDLLKIECIAQGTVIYDIKQTILDAGAATDLNGSHAIYDQSFIYLQKGLGDVATINDDCVTNANLPMVINDKASANKCIKQQYDYDFYLP